MVVKKRASLHKEKRKIRMKARPPSEREARFEESLLENPTEVLGDVNELTELALMGDEVGDPDASVLVQQEELLEEEQIGRAHV